MTRLILCLHPGIIVWYHLLFNNKAINASFVSDIPYRLWMESITSKAFVCYFLHVQYLDRTDMRVNNNRAFVLTDMCLYLYLYM